MYELLVGIPPYYSNNREELFENIKKGPLMIPKSLSEECKSLIKKVFWDIYINILSKNMKFSYFAEILHND